MFATLNSNCFQFAIKLDKERWINKLNQHPTLVNESYSSDSH